MMCQGYSLVHFGDYVLLEQTDASLIFGIHGKIHSISIALLKFTL